MKYSSKTGTPAGITTDCLVIGLKDAAKVARSSTANAAFRAATTDFQNKPGQTLVVHSPKPAKTKRLLIAGGADGSLSEADFRKIATAVANTLRTMPVKTLVWALARTSVKDRDSYWRITTGLAAVSKSIYQFQPHKTKTKGEPLSLRSVAVLLDARNKTSGQKAIKDANALKLGLDFARDLGNQPPNICHPNYLLSQARKLAKHDKVSVTSLDEKRMTALGMGAFMSVTQGSDTPGRMIIINYKGAAARVAPVVLVGKGITFDTGGISLKPPPAMDEMKFDMCGAAAVLGATKAAIEGRLPINLVTIVAAAENMPSGRASRPGDIVTSHSGQTIEILNTDAEGRLVLCDALSYAKRYKPKAVIDVATLTGACIVALGSHASAVFSNNDELGKALVNAGEYTGDRAWPLPVWDEYQSQLHSNFADVANVGGRAAGAVTAACFLSRFAQAYPWAHMDIAGSAFNSGRNKGATGRPVDLLYRYLREQAPGQR